MESAEQIFHKRGKVYLRVMLLSNNLLEHRAKTGKSPKEVLYLSNNSTLKLNSVREQEDWGLGGR